MNVLFIVACYMRLTACRKEKTTVTKEEILNAYLTDEHPSPVIEYMQMTSPHRDFDKYTEFTTPDPVKEYLDKTEKHNSIISQYI